MILFIFFRKVLIFTPVSLFKSLQKISKTYFLKFPTLKVKNKKFLKLDFIGSKIETVQIDLAKHKNELLPTVFRWSSAGKILEMIKKFYSRLFGFV